MTTTPQVDRDTERLESLGYRQELSRVLGFFDNFSVAFTYLSPMVGIFSLFVLGVGTAGPAYIWLMPIVVIGMLFVALVFGELGSHYPVAGALYQYSKFTVGPAYGWWVGWFYGVALLLTVASVDSGVAPYVASLSNNWFNTSLDATKHSTIVIITLCLLAVQTTVNIVGARAMGRVAKFGTYVEIFGTFGVFLILLIAGFHHGLGFLFTTHGAAHVATNTLGVNFHGNWLLGAALVSILAHVYIFYGFESAGDIAEETKDAGRQIPKAMRHALIWGGVASFIPTAGLLLAMTKHNPVGATIKGGGIPFILGQLPSWLQDCLLVLIVFAFFSCGSSIQGAGSRLAFSYARDGALPGSNWISRVNQRFKTPVNALLMGAVITLLFVVLVYATPGHDIHVWFVTYPANVNALVALVSFGVSGIYLSFFLTVIAAIVAKARGWQPEGSFRLGRWSWPVTIVAAAYLGLMLLNVVYPSGLASPRGYFNLDWITLVVIVVIAVVGLVYLLLARPDRKVAGHLEGAAPPPEAPPVPTT